MYFSSYEAIILDIEYHKSVERIYRQELRNTAYCKGHRLRITVHNGRRYYTIVSPDGDKYIGLEPTKHVQAIIKRHYLLEALKRIENNLKLLNKLEQNYRSINPNLLRMDLPKAYQELEASVFEIAGVPDMSQLTDEYATPAGFYEEHLKQVTSDGQLVRSKSENLLTMIYKKLDIRFLYEGRIQINGIVLFPDFRITSPDGAKSAFHDHFGKMNDPGYRTRNTVKVKDYLDAGLIPGYDVIFTFDYGETLNVFDIEQQLRLWLASPMNINVENRFEIEIA